ISNIDWLSSTLSVAIVDPLISSFISDVLECDKPCFERFTILCGLLNLKSLKHSDIKILGSMLLYAETSLLLNLINTFLDARPKKSSDQVRQLFEKAGSILLQMEKKVSYLQEEWTDASTNTVMLSLNIMRKSKKIDDWLKYSIKINAAVLNIVSSQVSIQEDQASSKSSQPYSGNIPLQVLITQLSEFSSNRDTEKHPCLWLENEIVKSRINDINVRCRQRQTNEMRSEKDEQMVVQWLDSFSSLNKSANVSHRPSSVSTQTDEISAMNQLPQSTPNKINFPPIRKLVPRDNADFLKDVSTPPDTPTKTLCHQPLNQMPNETQDLSLTLTSFADIGATSRACSNASRRRLPWTLSETLALWHEIQIALPGPPSWAKIRDKVFSTSRRTNVDLKDRWRVILRNPALQAQIRQYYGKWLASKNAVRTDMP
uniref:COMM domain-containing protein n=2 Tax=Mesocestoides corti TaxID=53468 RepID=A0A5K3ETX4_MESCO